MRKKKDAAGGRVLSFDVAARQKYLTGFRKRKKERRRLAQRQLLEQERQDKIDVKREHREDIKRQWKEVQWAECKVEKLLALKAAAEGDKALPQPKKRRKVTIEDAPGIAIMDRISEAGSDNALTINFGAEDDDPFGGCEVTTTSGAVGSSAIVAAEAGDSGSSEPEDDPPVSTLALLGTSRRAALEQKLALLRKNVFETDEQRMERRITSLRKQEAIRQRALTKRVTKTLEEKKKMKKKNKIKRKGKNKKSTARERRKRKQK